MLHYKCRVAYKLTEEKGRRPSRSASRDKPGALHISRQWFCFSYSEDFSFEGQLQDEILATLNGEFYCMFWMQNRNL